MAVPVRRASSSVRFVYQAWQLKLPEITPGPSVEEYRFVKIPELNGLKITDSQLPVVKDLIDYNGEAVRRFGPGTPDGQ